MIRAANSPSPPDDLSQRSNTGEATKEGRKSSPTDFRVAQVDQGQTSSPSTVEKTRRTGCQKKPLQLEEVVVTGSRIPADAGPTVDAVDSSYDRAKIERSGQTSSRDFLNTLPDVSCPAMTLASTACIPGQRAARLHGLPIGDNVDAA